ncbi:MULTISPECIES: flagellar motor switch protein FliG [unclassified Nitratiruptor]|uniref:flagellar motor switch protein FliG n=1 Tax=unclassified Nitratiruptor TaxID=2624044 RepID=UPI00191657E6|nr:MULTISPECIES: flagellar motor switch protein FliG [unclassified Nitratiruptor]BCD59906.1 flagellar motor switch protein FliG [Nitratiruptor sp. YY08-10]BCD63829.1 flagellar motor switch protein FliG [Nitratiruptor sp. YY08-14]
MSEEKKKVHLTKLQKAAILISALPEDISVQIFKKLKDFEVERIVKTILMLETPSKESVLEVLKEAYDNLKEASPVKIAPDHLKKILQKALPPEVLEKLLNQTFDEEEFKAIFKELEKLDPKMVANLIKNEHPQVIALILSQLKPSVAAEILQYIPKRAGVTNVQEEVIKRIASIEKINAQTLKIVANTLEEELLTIGAGTEETLSGIDIAAEIVNALPKEVQVELLEEVRKEDEILADNIEERMFKFEDILKLDNKAIIEILKNVDKNVLMMALKGAPQEILDKFLSNMSKRAAEMFLEDMEVLGPVKKSDVEKAQKKIIEEIKNLINKGVIEFGSGEEYV